MSRFSSHLFSSFTVSGLKLGKKDTTGLDTVVLGTTLSIGDSWDTIRSVLEISRSHLEVLKGGMHKRVGV